MKFKYSSGAQLYKHKNDKNWKFVGPDDSVLALVYPDKLETFCKLIGHEMPEELKSHV